MDGVQQLDSLLCHLATVPLEQSISETCRGNALPVTKGVAASLCSLIGLHARQGRLGTGCWTALMLLLRDMHLEVGLQHEHPSPLLPAQAEHSSCAAACTAGWQGCGRLAAPTNDSIQWSTHLVAHN